MESNWCEVQAIVEVDLEWWATMAMIISEIVFDVCLCEQTKLAKCCIHCDGRHRRARGSTRGHRSRLFFLWKAHQNRNHHQSPLKSTSSIFQKCIDSTARRPSRTLWKYQMSVIPPIAMAAGWVTSKCWMTIKLQIVCKTCDLKSELESTMSFCWHLILQIGWHPRRRMA